MKKTGFTLIEILVVVGILGIIAFIGTNMFFTILKGSTKTRVLAEVKQNGNYALGVMERMIRNARKIEECQVSADHIKIQNPDEDWTDFLCCGSPSLIASESGGLTCSDSGIENARLTSSNVQVSCGTFISCTQATGGPPVITINFTLSQLGSPPRPEEQARVDFGTTVTLRNY